MTRYEIDSARIAPAAEPLPDDVRHAIDAIMRGQPPLVLFTTLARDRRLFFKFFNSGLLDRGHLTIRQREIVIDRVTASCGAEYEWGVHVSVFAAKAGLTEAQITSLTVGGPDDTCWTDADRLLIRLCSSFCFPPVLTASGQASVRLPSLFRPWARSLFRPYYRDIKTRMSRLSWFL